MSSTPEYGPKIALLFDDQSIGARLRDALSERGACIVLESTVSTFDAGVLAEHDPDVVVLNLDPAEEDTFERVVEALDVGHQRLVLNDAEATRDLAGWDAARWARHLAAKILGTDVDPPRPATATPVPVPVQAIADAGAAEGLQPAESIGGHAAADGTEPAMNIALEREIGSVLDDLDGNEPERASPVDDPVQEKPPFAGPSANDAVHDDVDALLAAFMAQNAQRGDSGASSVALPEAFESAVRSGLDPDQGRGSSESGAATSTDEPSPDSAADGAPVEGDAGAARETADAWPQAVRSSIPDTIDFDLDALLAELPAPSAPLPTGDATSSAPVTAADESGDAENVVFEPVDPSLEPVIPERLPQHEALAHPVDTGSGDLSTADLDALLADFLPPAPLADAETPAPIEQPVGPGAADDPLLSILGEDSRAAVGSGFEDFDPETWSPPEAPQAVARATDAGDSPAGMRTSSPSSGGEDVPQPVATAPVRIGEETPDLELMLDEMFDQPVSDEPDGQGDASAELAAPDWGLVDFDSEPPQSPNASETDRVDGAPAPEMETAVDGTPAFGSLEGLDLLPIEEMSPQTGSGRAQFGAQGHDLQRVIAIGASIGGPDAVREFLMAMQPGLPVLVVVAQHLDEAFFPGYAAQLERALPHPVRIAADGVVSVAGEVLLVPPHARISIDPEGGVHLLPAGETRYTPSIDETFTRIADVFGERALALVFSGMANDAVSGMQHIVERGGRVWTQARETCVVSAMVDAADAAGIVASTGTPQELAARLNADLSAG